MSENSKADLYIDHIRSYILPFIDYSELQRSYETDMVYAKGVLNRLHITMGLVYGGETLDSLEGDAVIPGIIRGKENGNMCIALLTLDLSSSGEHWGTDFLCRYGVISQDGNSPMANNDKVLASEVKEINSAYLPYDYAYTATIPDDIHVDMDALPYQLRDVLNDFRNHHAELLFEQEALDGVYERMSDTTGSGYLFVVTDDSDYYIPNAVHIQRDDNMAMYPDDESAAEAAEADGVNLIYGLPDVPDGIYLDTPENRAVIVDYYNARDELLTQIAKRHCRVETLETRKRDSLDFHEVSVWGLKSALEEAYNTGIAHQRARTNDLDRLDEVKTVPEADAPDFAMLEQQLRERLADNYNQYKREMLGLGKEGLFYAAAEILPVQEAYSYFTHEHVFTESDIDFLLKFENPLELISDRWSSGPIEGTGRIDAIFADMERTLLSGGYTLAADEPAPDAPETPRQAAVGGDGAKLSVLDRIRQAAKEARERPTASQDKNDRKKTEQEH